jgi:hypothetical protein
VAVQPRPRQGGKDADKGIAVHLEQQRIKAAPISLNFSLARDEEIRSGDDPHQIGNLADAFLGIRDRVLKFVLGFELLQLHNAPLAAGCRQFIPDLWRAAGSAKASSGQAWRSAKQDRFFETPSPSDRSWGAVIFHQAGSRSTRVQTE